MKASVGAKATAVYAASSFIARGLAVLTLPIFTRVMPVEQIGVVNLFNSWQSMIGAFATLSLTSGGFMLAMKEYRDERDQYTSSVLSLTSLIALLLMLAIVVFRGQVTEITGLSAPLCILMAVGFVFMPAYDFWMGRQRYEYRYKAVGALSIASSVLSVVAALAAVLIASSTGYEELGEVRLVASSIVTFGVAAVLWVLIMKRGRVLYQPGYWKFSLALSLPLVGHTIAYQVLSTSDRVMIGAIVGNGAVGIYGTVYSVSSLALILWQAINSSFVPFLYENVDSREGSIKVKTVVNKMLFGLGLFVVLVTLLAPEMLMLLTTEEYVNASEIVPPIIAGVFMVSVSNIYSNMLIYHKKTQYIMVSSIVAAALNVLMNLFAIKGFGYYAAAYTTLIAYVVLGLVQGIVSERAHMRSRNGARAYNDRIVALASAAAIAGCLACIPLYPYPIVRYGLVASVAFVAVVFRGKIAEFVQSIRG